MTRTKTALIVFPPFNTPTSPPLGAAMLKGFVERELPDWRVKIFDLNLWTFNRLLTALSRNQFHLDPTAFPEGFRLEEGWEEQKRLYAVLHLFDAEGHYRDSQIWCAGSWAEQQREPDGAESVLARARAHLAGMLRSLPKQTYKDIAIRPFQLIGDGVFFGLVAKEDDDGGWAELYPDHLGFGEPWDGTYDT